MNKRYAVIDIETTGGRASRDRITEVAIVLHDGESILDTFETLINPECYIPYGITQLTGITQEMVAEAPKFYEVARDIVEMTEGAIFVAHNVRFDYSFLREEFARLGYTYSRKQLCTVRLSRKTFPGLPSYSLDNITRHLGIFINNRHRAMGDALATTQLLEQILGCNGSEKEVKAMVNLGIRESLLPKNFDLEKIHALPEACGVYYFHDTDGNVVYVGKSINIKKRVAEHFADKTEKASKLQQAVHDISFELTGSELVALLHESHEIKRLRPPVNRAQRQRRFPYIIHSWVNDDGYRCFSFEQANAGRRKELQVISEFPTTGRAKGRLGRIMEQFELCARLTGLQNGRGACFHYHLKQCHGACAGQESPSDYNARADEAMEILKTVFEEDFFIIDSGRQPSERSVVLVEEGAYRGFGYFDAEDFNGSLDELHDLIRPSEGNPETTRIIQRYLSQHPEVEIIRIS